MKKVNDYNMMDYASLCETSENRDTSHYIETHYDELLSYTRRVVKKTKKCSASAEDILQDVYISVKNLEDNGQLDEIIVDSIPVQQAVKARIKKFALNVAYVTGAEIHMSYSRERGHYSSVHIESADSNFNTNTDIDLDSLNSFQKAYAVAATYGELELVDDMISLKQDIEYCISVSDEMGFNMMALLKNIEAFNCEFDKRIMEKVSVMARKNMAFADAIRNILTCSKENKGLFNSIVEAIA